MNNLTNDYIAVDTNVFEHLLNPKENKLDHIEILLYKLREDNIRLIIDSKGRIWNEYTNRIIEEIKKCENSNYNELFRYWLSPEPKNKWFSVNQEDNLMVAIKGVIGRDKATDRIFVYVAICGNWVLVTNDRNDILDEGNIRYERRKKLLKIAKKQNFKSAKIYDSQEAHDNL